VRREALRDRVEGFAVGSATDAKDCYTAVREEEGAGAKIGGSFREPRGEETGGRWRCAVLPRGGNEEEKRLLGQVLGFVMPRIDDVECDAARGEETVEAESEGFAGSGF